MLVKISEKDYNLGKENQRFWGEIAVHKYLFDRQEREIEEIKTLTKDEFIDHFKRVFFTERRRLDYELTTEKHKQEQEEWKAKNGEKYFHQRQRWRR